MESAYTGGKLLLDSDNKSTKGADASVIDITSLDVTCMPRGAQLSFMGYRM